MCAESLTAIHYAHQTKQRKGVGIARIAATRPLGKSSEIGTCNAIRQWYAAGGYPTLRDSLGEEIMFGDKLKVKEAAKHLCKTTGT